jgi:arginyl-tRNA synthetase
MSKTMDPFRAEAVERIARLSGSGPEEVEASLVSPPKPELGDLAFPCFALSKREKKAPPAIAAELAGKLAGELSGGGGRLLRAAAAGPYVNLTYDRTRYAEHVLREAALAGEEIGRSSAGAGKVVAIDYSSPNIAKPFHVGHLRSTIIGQSLYRLFETLGYRPVGINHLGDWGTQFGKLITALKRWGSEKDLGDVMALNALYVKFHEEEKREPALTAEARDWFRRQEEGDPEALRLWKAIRDVSLTYFQGIYDRIGARFDHYVGESFFNDKMAPIIERAEKSGLARISSQEPAGALVIDLQAHGIDTPAMLRKADGTTLYLTRDLAAAEVRHAAFHFHKLLYVVGAEQSLHFQQLFKVLELLGHRWAADCVHVAFGRVIGMSTREGNVIYLEALLDEARQRALRNMQENVEKRPDLAGEAEMAEVAEAIGMAAIFFADLSTKRIKDYTFDWGRAISFEGDTGPYLINAHARIAGIIRKCGVELPDPSGVDWKLLAEPEAHRLVTLVARYGRVLEEAAGDYEPSVVAGYLLDLAKALHSSYQKLRVKGEEENLARARLLLFVVVKRILASGLRILGIRPLEKM